MRALEQLVERMEHAQFENFITSVKKGWATHQHDWHRVKLIRDWLGMERREDEDELIEAAVKQWADRNVRLVKQPRKRKAKVVAIGGGNAAAQAYRDAEADWEPVDPEVLRREAAIEAAIEFADEAIETADLEEREAA